MSGQTPQASVEQAEPASAFPTLAAMAVFVVGYFVFPPESSRWSDRGPHLIVTALVAGVVAALVSIIGRGIGNSPSALAEDSRDGTTIS